MTCTRHVIQCQECDSCLTISFLFQTAARLSELCAEVLFDDVQKVCITVPGVRQLSEEELSRRLRAVELIRSGTSRQLHMLHMLTHLTTVFAVSPTCSGTNQHLVIFSMLISFQGSLHRSCTQAFAFMHLCFQCVLFSRV